MSASKVYWSDFRAHNGNNLIQKLQKLIVKAGFDDIDFQNKFAAIKIHFGEPGNLAYLRPNYAKAVADLIKERGGIPYLTDCNTLYAGRRKNAIEHIDSAYENGFSPFSTGCHVIIADGIKGTDDVEVPVKNGEYIQNAKIGRAVMDADIIISLNHFKGHESTGFGGAIKNLGMGCGSRAGKMEQHCEGQPEVNENKCVGCHMCQKACGQDAITYTELNKAHIDENKCVGCGKCIGYCALNAISNKNYSADRLLNFKMAEYAQAVCQDRPQIHISLVMDVSPYCDCHAENDAPIIPDVGMFVSKDPVALDRACADMCNRQEPYENSILGEKLKYQKDRMRHDIFQTVSPNTDWTDCLDHAEKIGLGQQEYELIKV